MTPSTRWRESTIGICAKGLSLTSNNWSPHDDPSDADSELRRERSDFIQMMAAAMLYHRLYTNACGPLLVPGDGEVSAEVVS
jgi:hypothetical protein